MIVEQTIDLAGDVAIALLKGPTSVLIKERFKARILASYDRREPLFIKERRWTMYRGSSPASDPANFLDTLKIPHHSHVGGLRSIILCVIYSACD